MAVNFYGRIFIVLTLLAPCLAMPSDAAIDSTLHAAMRSHPGTAIVMDVASGNIIAQHRIDIAAGRLAAPGSAIKPFTLLALLHSSRFDPSNRLLCRRQLTVGGHRLDCTHPDLPIPLDAADALAYSCNSYFAAAAPHLSNADLRNEFEKVGLASPTGLATHASSRDFHALIAVMLRGWRIQSF